MTPLYDKNGRPIRAGDLLRTPHFRGARRRQFYLYHTAVRIDGRLWMFPTSELDPESRERCKGTGRCPIGKSQAANCEIIDGCGEEGCDFWADRPRQRSTAGTAVAPEGGEALSEDGRRDAAGTGEGRR